ncbi:MAG: hypothetical protein AAGI68_16275 [Planctomycetota bacterium]
MQTIEETAQPKPAAKKRSGKKKPGRPPGSKTADPPRVTAVLSRCPRCGSTNREPYTSKHEMHHCGVDPATGQPYTHKVWKRCKCSDCGQLRTDITYENRTTA